MTNRSPDFAGTRALITGASSGIGQQTARAFAACSAHVVATGRRAEALSEITAEAESSGWQLKALAGDLTDPAFITRLAAFAGDVDVLINCAGTLKHTPFLDSDPADWESVYAINVLSLLHLTQLVARGMVERQKGHIINVSSILARRVYPYTLAYAGAKHAVRAISDGLRVELQGKGVKVTEVAPGLTETNIFRDIDHPRVIEAYAKFNFPRLKPAEVARAILFAAAAPPESCPEVIAINPVGQFT